MVFINSNSPIHSTVFVLWGHPVKTTAYATVRKKEKKWGNGENLSLKWSLNGIQPIEHITHNVLT